MDQVARELRDEAVRQLSDQVVAQRRQILDVFLRIFVFFGSRSVKFWSFSGPGDAWWGFGSPGGDFRALDRAKNYFWGSISGPFFDSFGVCF